MRTLGVLGVAFVVLCLTSCSGKDKKDGDKAGDKATDKTGEKAPDKTGNKDAAKEKTNAERIIGSWKVVKGKGDVGTIISFANDGTATFREGEKAKKVENWSYKIEGDTITITPEKEKPTTCTIKLLTDKELVLEYPTGDQFGFEKVP
jgi:uncharacterized protein (TIGR03066 family)